VLANPSKPRKSKVDLLLISRSLVRSQPGSPRTPNNHASIQTSGSGRRMAARRGARAVSDMAGRPRRLAVIVVASSTISALRRRVARATYTARRAKYPAKSFAAQQGRPFGIRLFDETGSTAGY
jgi:hypothetical protein